MKRTGKMLNFNGVPIFVPNDTQDGNGFYVSYNNRDIGTYGSDTTALVKGQMEKFFILNGDHRVEYGKLIPYGIDVCLDYFKRHSNLTNKYSDAL